MDRNVQNPVANNTGIYTFTRGYKFFELSNHLGNVLVTLSDKKIGHDGGNGTVDYYNADAVTAKDYYPGGMLIPGRDFTTGSGYRYSINGQEKSPEIAPNTTTAEFWQYDARIGRRRNVDPAPKMHESPYAAFANNPLRFIDPKGADTIDVKSRTFDHLGRKSGQKGFDETNMMRLFTVKTHETHTDPWGEEVEIRREMSSGAFFSQYTLNGSYHTIIDSERKEFSGSTPVMSILSVNTGHASFSEAVNVIGVESLENIRSTTVSHLKSRWWSPLTVDLLKYFPHGGKYDVKSRLLGKSPLVYINGAGLFESDYVGNLVFGAIMANFKSLTSSLTAGDGFQDTGFDDVSDSHGIIIGHFEGESKISLSTFQKVSRYTLDKWTFIQGKVYSEYNIDMLDSGKELQLKTNN